MKGMANFTVKSLRANKVRTLVTIAGIALAAALVTAVFTSFTSLSHFLYQAEVATSGEWMASAIAKDAQTLEGDIAAAQEDAQVTDTAVMRTVGYAELTPEQQVKLGEYQAIASVEGNVDQMLSIRASKGRLPERAGEIALFYGWQHFEDVQVGDEITLPVGTLVDEGFSMTVGRSAQTVTFASTDPPEGETHLEGLHDRTFEVVGFYEQVPYALSSLYGTTAVTVDDPDATTGGEVFITCTDVDSSEEVQAVAERLFPDEQIQLHNSLLRYMGLGANISIWNTFSLLIVILASVILLACVSLIFNAFNISVAERIQQFGLLSSVGASRGQLRRSVLLEACIVALIGIPAGLLLGIGGCWATFSCLGSTIADLAGAAEVPFDVWVDGRIVAVAALLTFVTVLISAWVPAKRASRMNIIDAIRTTASTRISKRGRVRAARMTDAQLLWKGGSLGDRILGIGGRLANVNRKRSKTKGRAASVSLALAVVLLVTAGSLNLFLGVLLDAVSGGAPAGQVSVSAIFTSTERAEGAEDGPPALPTTLLPAPELAKEAAVFQDTFDELAQAPNAEALGWYLAGEAMATLPMEMAGEALLSTDERSTEDPAGDGYVTEARIAYVSDGAFDAYAEGLGLDPATFHEGKPRAIGVSQAYGNNGRTYALLEMLRGEGTVRVSDERVPLDVVAVADEGPVITGGYGEGPLFIVPLSAAFTISLVSEPPLFRSIFNATDGDHAALAQELNDRGHACLDDLEESREIAFVSYNDYQAEKDSNQMLVTIVNIFCLLFTVILGLIAMANVFNTVTNSLILRRREFAVMRSVGMSSGQFHRMIVDECASFGLKGLVPGLVIATGVAYLVWIAIAQSLSNLTFTLPWAYVGVAVAMTVAVMAVSVAYGLHRCNADNIIDALRAE